MITMRVAILVTTASITLPVNLVYAQTPIDKLVGSVIGVSFAGINSKSTPESLQKDGLTCKDGTDFLLDGKVVRYTHCINRKSLVTIYGMDALVSVMFINRELMDIRAHAQQDTFDIKPYQRLINNLNNNYKTVSYPYPQKASEISKPFAFDYGGGHIMTVSINYFMNADGTKFAGLETSFTLLTPAGLNLIKSQQN